MSATPKLRPVIESLGNKIHARCPLCADIISGPEQVRDHYNIVATLALASHLLVCERRSG